MIKKCDHPGCPKAGTCRAPKNRELRDYWFFCQEHAAEYNKNWNYYANMSPQEINAEWERETFGTADVDRQQKNHDARDYAKFIDDFLSGRDRFDQLGKNRPAPSPTVMGALKLFDLNVTVGLREISARYRKLAKKYHPDTGGTTSDAEKFAKISAAYDILKKHFGKK